ncbi:hypothetical protein HJC23_002615 [Cyclotella cryptica]|uniref:Mitochondrial carrier protein n=1 Tax=Cyclotella cryptica TaxID=29204 RepID=A0ABD3PXQ7_9STRA|eukprot:CCRYP_010363-RA/>CCRYP_010363-RA protein AED:0.08 eAED:0.19 QI:0/-1/0/1/-1/1/1/0/411
MPNLITRFASTQIVSILLFLSPRGHAFSSSRAHPTIPGKSLTVLNLRTSQNNDDFSRREFLGSVAVAVAATFTSSSLPARATEDSIRPMNQRMTQPTMNSNANQNLPSTASTTMHQSESTTATTTTALQESISGFLSGTAVAAVKTIVKYPLDTATVRLQMPDTKYTLQNLPPLFRGSFDGISAPLLSNIPAGAIFFAVKDAVQSSIRDVGLPTWMSTSIAVGAALPPYWAIRNPSEVIKTRLQVGAEGYTSEGMTTVDAFRLALSRRRGGMASLYVGYSENVLYGFPADVIKFVVYDSLSGGRRKKDLSPLDGAMFGAVSTGVAQWITTPLDVVRNRIMAEVVVEEEEGGDEGRKGNYLERLVKIANEEGVEALFAGTAPRIAKAMLSGALQFAAYEETKQTITNFFLRR